ncbi:MAG: hypothetical protein MJE77_30110, partial [Proteobacteria bacterium]|nr:hypothetical protein [Pseudomonadota bacterium]
MASMLLLSRCAVAITGITAALWVLHAGLPHAEAKGKKTYYFVVSKVQLTEGIPGEIRELVVKQLTLAMARHDRLTTALPDGAPDPRTDPKGFVRYVKKRKIRPFRINVEVIQYSHELESASGGGQQLIVSLALRMFGETMPVRVMAFSGEGSAKIKMGIGKTLRPRDTRIANKDAAELAINDALATSLQQLAANERSKKKTR